MADRPTVVDNNTSNGTHIARVALALVLPERRAWPVLRTLGAAYVLVLSGAVVGYAGDDLNKLPWMVRIAADAFPDAVRESDYLSASARDMRPDAGTAAQALRDSVLYRMAYADVGRLVATDRARPGQGVPPAESCGLAALVEAYTTTNGIVRVYRVRAPDVLGRSFFSRAGRRVGV